jgi:exopolyphosphatase/guanosine-5'-triphosphate,3'-diphosphate pyrophosphatase
VADVSTDQQSMPQLIDIDRRLEIVRLGQDVDRTGRFAPEALARTFEACRRYAAVIEKLGVVRTKMVATSATRDARNREEFVAGVRDVLGVAPEVISGEEEARLSFVGATRELAAQGVATPFLVVDIGGGSTEFARGVSQPEASVSVDMGCVRLTERYLLTDPPTEAEIAAARTEIRRQLDRAARSVSLDRAGTLVGLAGTVTTMAAMALGLSSYDPARIHHSRMSAADVHAITERLLAMSLAQRRALPFMHPGRADVIGGGALVLDEIMRRVGPHLSTGEVVVSEHDILDGIALDIATEATTSRGD